MSTELVEPEEPLEKPNTTSERAKVRQAYLDKHFDKNYAVALIDKIGSLCLETYFRGQFIGFEMPTERLNPNTAYVYISNHSGMAFPWDAMTFGAYHNHPYAFDKGSFRTLVSPELSETRLMNPFMVSNFWKKMGGVDATYSNFETLMQQEDFNVMVYPEGIPGIGKGFNRKYQLQKFHTSYLRLALEYNTSIQWVSTVNGEYVNPYSYSFEIVNKYSSKIGIPFLPLTIMLAAVILQPWFFYFSFPAQLTFVKGPEIRPRDLLGKPYEDLTEDDIKKLNNTIKKLAQEHLIKAEKEHGKKPYNWGDFFSKMWQNRGRFPFFMPPLWPLIFMDFDRRYERHGNNFEMQFTIRGFLGMLSRNPIYLAYFIPILGWIPLLIVGYSGHRISANKRRKEK